MQFSAVPAGTLAPAALQLRGADPDVEHPAVWRDPPPRSALRVRARGQGAAGGAEAWPQVAPGVKQDASVAAACGRRLADTGRADPASPKCMGCECPERVVPW